MTLTRLGILALATVSLFMGTVAGAAMARGSFHCTLSSHDGGITYQELCERTVTP